MTFLAIFYLKKLDLPTNFNLILTKLKFITNFNLIYQVPIKYDSYWRLKFIVFYEAMRKIRTWNTFAMHLFTSQVIELKEYFFS